MKKSPRKKKEEKFLHDRLTSLFLLRVVNCSNA